MAKNRRIVANQERVKQNLVPDETAALDTGAGTVGRLEASEDLTPDTKGGC